MAVKPIAGNARASLYNSVCVSRLVTTNVVYLDSQWMRVPVTPLPPGIPVGLFNGWDGTTLRPHTEVFTLSYSGETPATLLSRLAIARSRGVKMVIAEWYHFPIGLSLAIIASVLTISVVASYIWPRHVELEVSADALEDIRKDPDGDGVEG